jgi:hypothetical protein
VGAGRPDAKEGRVIVDGSQESELSKTSSTREICLLTRPRYSATSSEKSYRLLKTGAAETVDAARQLAMKRIVCIPDAGQFNF